MHDKHLHIDNTLESNYPPPGIPADDAWESMRKVLDTDLQTSSVQKPPAIRNTIWKYGSIFLLITIVLIWIINSNKQDVVQITKHKENINQQANKPAIKDEHQLPENDFKKELIKKDSTRINPIVNSQQYKTNDSAKEAILSPGLSSGTDLVTDKRTKRIHNTTNNNETGNAGKDSLERGNLANRNKPLTLKDHSPTDPSAAHTLSTEQLKQRKNNLTEDTKYKVSHKNKEIKRNKEKEEHIQANTKLNLAASTAKNKKANRVNNQGTAEIKKNTDRAQLKTGSPDPLKPKNSLFNTKPAITRFTLAKDNSETGKNKRAADKKQGRFSTGFSFGLQWNVPAPLQGTSYYFSGTNGKSKPYTLLLPELWISKALDLKNKHRIQLLINANQQYFTGDKEIAFYSGQQSIQDTTFVTRSTKLLKTSGIGSTLQYNYNLNIKWSAGVGINYGIYGKALTHTQTIRKMDNNLLSDSLFGITKSSAYWNYIYQSLFTGKIEIVYSFKRFQSGAAIFIPFNNISASPGNNIRPLNGEFFLRFKLK